MEGVGRDKNRGEKKLHNLKNTTFTAQRKILPFSSTQRFVHPKCLKRSGLRFEFSKANRKVYVALSGILWEDFLSCLVYGNQKR